MKTRFLLVGFAMTMAFAAPRLSSAATWSVPGDFETIQLAVDSEQVVDGDEILVGPGYFMGARITKSLIIRGSGDTHITEGFKPWSNRPFNAGFMFRGEKAENGSGTRISNIIFEYVDFPIFGSQKGAVISDVTITDCTMENAIQAITMWHADGWTVKNNRIIDLEALHGGGIGILVGSYSGDDAFENHIENNMITGTVYVDPDDKGGYNAAGITVVSDHRHGNTGGAVEGNLVISNSVILVSDNPEVVPVVAIELSDPTGEEMALSVTENTVAQNEVQQTETPISLEGKRLDEVNEINEIQK